MRLFHSHELLQAIQWANEDKLNSSLYLYTTDSKLLSPVLKGWLQIGYPVGFLFSQEADFLGQVAVMNDHSHSYVEARDTMFQHLRL